MAAINALEWCIRHNISDVCIYHDYEGVSRWYLNEWEANSQIARFYIKKRDQAFKALNVSFVKVKGHSNNEYNDMADAEAKKAIKNMKKNN
jgi:ribonuclease HI